MDYDTYKSETFSCKHCGWTGLGSEASQGEMFNAGFELDCPKCHERFPVLICFQIPKDDETISIRQKWLDSLLKDVSQLPELHDDFMAFVLREITKDNKNYIVITYQDKIIWEEVFGYEYYERFIEIGELFKQKYGDKMIDFVPDVDGYSLYGDKASSDFQVENFRRKLRK